MRFAVNLMNDPEFPNTILYRDLQSMPLGFVDIGARNGIYPYFAPVAELAAVLAFEPDEAGASQLRESLESRWRLAEVEQIAIGSHTGQAQMHLFAHGVNDSLLPVNPAFRERYRAASLAERGTAIVAVSTLDDVLFKRCARQPFWGEILKLDVQGAELMLLQAAPRTLRERTVAVVSEAILLDAYSGQASFADLERFFADSGFTFYGFLDQSGWSRKYIDKRNAHGYERLFMANALFLRDPLTCSNFKGALSVRQYQTLYLSALLFGYFDFAIELAVEGEFAPDEAEKLIRIAQRQAAFSPSDGIAKVETLLMRMKNAPDDALLELGRFIDEHRGLFNVADAALSRATPTVKPRTGTGSPKTT